MIAASLFWIISIEDHLLLDPGYSKCKVEWFCIGEFGEAVGFVKGQPPMPAD
jgi:hypothetical protein